MRRILMKGLVGLLGTTMGCWHGYENDYGCSPCDYYDYDDVDGDGYDTSSDCDDADAGIFPGAEEVCNEVDDDCDGDVDEDLEVVQFLDDDGDGFGDHEQHDVGCPLEGWVENDLDCDDSDATVNPDATEVCDDSIDNDCDDDVDGDDRDCE